MESTRILACDGGGIRGLLTAIWIRRLLDKRPDLLDRVTLFAGTSTGGIIALALARGALIDQVISLYQCRGEAVFARNWRHYIGLTGARYKNNVLRKELLQLLGTHRLKELRPVLIPSFQLDNKGSLLNRRWKPKFWTQADGNELAANVGMYTTAAPTYFPTYKGYIDGGVVANNPSMAAVTEMLRAGHALQNLRLLSLGTGACGMFEKRENHDFGMLDVGVLVSIMLSGGENVAAFECRQLLGEHQCRFNPVLPVKKAFALDAVKRISEIVQVAWNMDLTLVENWVSAHW